MNRRRRIAGVLAAQLLAGGCASLAPPPREEPPPAPARAVAALPPPELAPRTLAEPERMPRPPELRLLEALRFTLQLEDADLRSVLLGLGRESSLNVVVAPDVTGVVSADLVDVSLREILDRIVAARGYRYVVEDSLLSIFREDRETRSYRVDYPSYVRKGETRVELAGFMGAASTAGTNGTAGASSGAGAGAAQDSSMSALETAQQSDLWAEIEAGVRTLVLGSPDAAQEASPVEPSAQGALAARRVIVSRQSGLVTVTAESAVLEQVEHYLAEVADSTERQVLIEAQVVEVRLGDELDLGLDIEAAVGSGGVFERMILPGLREANLAQALAPVLTEGGVSIGFARDNFGLILRALAKQTDVRVLSTPRVSTLNNHQAIIKVVRNQVFFVAETETVINQNLAQTNTQFVPTIVPVGVNLDVTPQISDDGEITLHVRPSVSEVVSVAQQPRASESVPQNGSLPVVDIRETDSVLRVHDGQTIVIGGLVQSREYEQQRKVPLLGDLPYLGAVFRGTRSDEIRSELLIFLTPSVLDPPRVARVNGEAHERLEQVEALGRLRTHAPWWRKPRNQSYGAR
jgi:MSHA type pilus biogenesis protein MshL